MILTGVQNIVMMISLLLKRLLQLLELTQPIHPFPQQPHWTMDQNKVPRLLRLRIYLQLNFIPRYNCLFLCWNLLLVFWKFELWIDQTVRDISQLTHRRILLEWYLSDSPWNAPTIQCELHHSLNVVSKYAMENYFMKRTSQILSNNFVNCNYFLEQAFVRIWRHSCWYVKNNFSERGSIVWSCFAWSFISLQSSHKARMIFQLNFPAQSYEKPVT